jgi:release factor glutamine methyltransferase
MHRIIDILSLSTDYLERYAVSHPRLNAELLLSDVLGVSRIQLYLQHDKPLVEQELTALRKLLKARAAHKPIQYLLGRTEFFSLPFLVTEGVFIPRPETEILVEEVIRYLESFVGPEDIVVFDVGTGCGCIAISLAHSIERCHVHASDISPDAVSLAKSNALKSGVADRVTVLQGDLFEPYRGNATLKADVIVSNPPYIPEDDWDSLPDEVKGYEPRNSLVAGKAGLDVIRRIIHSAGPFLKPGGRLFLEIGQGQRDAVVSLFKVRKNYMDIQSRQDYNRTERVVSASFSLADKSIIAG